MRLSRLAILLPVALVIGIGCSGAPTAASTGIYMLFGRDFVFEVQRVAMHPRVSMPDDPIPDIEYVGTSARPSYRIRFSGGGETVLLNDTTRLDWTEVGDEGMPRYETDEGLWAGMGFFVWIEDGQVNAELRHYGSGVPVVKSEWGRLTPN